MDDIQQNWLKTLLNTHKETSLASILLFEERPDFIPQIEDFLTFLKLTNLQYLAHGDDAILFKESKDNVIIRISTDMYRHQSEKVLQNLTAANYRDSSKTFIDNNGKTRTLCIMCEILPLGEDNVSEAEANELDRALLSDGVFWRESKPQNAIRFGDNTYVSDHASIRHNSPEGFFKIGQIIRLRNIFKQWSKKEQEQTGHTLIPRYDEIIRLGNKYKSLPSQQKPAPSQI